MVVRRSGGATSVASAGSTSAGSVEGAGASPDEHARSPVAKPASAHAFEVECIGLCSCSAGALRVRGLCPPTPPPLSLVALLLASRDLSGSCASLPMGTPCSGGLFATRSRDVEKTRRSFGLLSMRKTPSSRPGSPLSRPPVSNKLQGTRSWRPGMPFRRPRMRSLASQLGLPSASERVLGNQTGVPTRSGRVVLPENPRPTLSADSGLPTRGQRLLVFSRSHSRETHLEGAEHDGCFEGDDGSAEGRGLGDRGV
jgi:hypothetical protein